MDLKQLEAIIDQQKTAVFISGTLKRDSQKFTELLFNTFFDSEIETGKALLELEALFLSIRNLACPDIKGQPCKRWDEFCEGIPALFTSLKLDAEAILQYDPAAKSINEVYMAYPGFFAIAVYRMARVFFKLGLPLIPRLMTEYAHQKTGIDINPGACIGQSFFIDHGTGAVIGETTVIKDHVKLYQGVTLGALSVRKQDEDVKRHPTIENHVTIYANATILGGATVIGEHCIIGGNTWLTQSVPANSIVTHNPQVEISSKKS